MGHSSHPVRSPESSVPLSAATRPPRSEPIQVIDVGAERTARSGHHPAGSARGNPVAERPADGATRSRGWRAIVRGRTRITPEGRYYLVLIGLLVSGAVMRQVNLLILLAGLMLGPLIVNWQSVGRSVRKLALRRRVPPLLSAGTWVPIIYEVESRHSLTAALGLTIEDTIESLDPPPRPRRATSSAPLSGSRPASSQPVPTQPAPLAEASPDGSAKPRVRRRKRLGRRPDISPRTVVARTMVPDLLPGQTLRQTVRVRFPRRGRYVFQDVVLRSRYPFGLMERTMTDPSHLDVLVGPRRGQLRPGARQRLVGLHSGRARRQNRRGLDDGEFYGLRPWRRGDSLRWIDWRSSARRQEPMVRQFEQTFEPSSCFLLDLAEVPRPPRPAPAVSTAQTEDGSPDGASPQSDWTGWAQRTWAYLRTGDWREPPSVDIPEDEPIERALSLLTTLIGELCHYTSGRLVIALVGREPVILQGESSPTLYHELVERLATIEPGPARSWTELRETVADSHATASRWCVISSRADVRSGQSASAGYPRPAVRSASPTPTSPSLASTSPATNQNAHSGSDPTGPAVPQTSPLMRRLSQAAWIDASGPDLETWMTFEE